MSLLRAADDAELRGDAAGALQIMEDHPGDGQFWRPWRIRRLFELTMLRSLLPGWVTSRWILAQALQHLPDSTGGVPGNRVHRALAIAIELRGGPQNLPGVDAVDVRCRVIDHDWVFRQLHLYELGGLAHFLDRVAPADLVAGADRIREWATASMGGFRLLARDAGTVSWQDLGSGETVRMANIGSAALVVPGECVIGRLVPIQGGVMFESAPLVIAETRAREVAIDPPSWVDTLRSAGGTAGADVVKSGDLHGLLTDVPLGIWMLALCDAAGLTDEAMPTDEQQAAAVLGIARLLLDDAEPPPFNEVDAVDPWSCIGAALLSPSLLVTLADKGQPADRALLARLGDVLAEPAASVCRELAVTRGAAA